MPDWTYRTVFRPLLFRLPARIARDLALGSMGRLGRMPLGRTVIEWMGHMQADPRLQVTTPWPAESSTAESSTEAPARAGLAAASGAASDAASDAAAASDVELSRVRLATPVGLGCGLDIRSNATAALSQFGFGLLEIGPVSVEGCGSDLQRDDDLQQLRYASQPSVRLSMAQRWIVGFPDDLSAWLIVRLADDQAEHVEQLATSLGGQVDAFAAPVDWPPTALRQLASTTGLWLVVPADASPAELAGWTDSWAAIAQGWIVGPPRGEADSAGAWELGKQHYDTALAATRALRRLLGEAPLISQSLGVHQAEDALECREAGAQLVQVNSGLVFSGPGLPKRINDALLHQLTAKVSRRSRARQLPRHSTASRFAWFWALLIGVSMFGGGLLAVGIAATRVVLPYDEAMSGLTRQQLTDINPRLLAFMTHDRVTLSGTMMCVGLLYSILAWWGVRRGLHWAARAVAVSAMVGFVSFFSFLGFGYFDPFHAFVSAVLFQFLLLLIHSDLAPRQEPEAPELTDSPRWRLAQWGQLLFVIHGAVLITAGLVITKVGMTDVFVAEDLEFMETTADCLQGAHPSLVPLVAHDRATFGGMLLSCGSVVLLSSLWGFRRGQAWLWWGLLLAGSAAYLTTIVVHWAVGYLSLKHLLPAYGGLLLLWAGSLLSWPHLAAANRQLEQRWRRWLD